MVTTIMTIIMGLGICYGVLFIGAVVVWSFCSAFGL